MFAFNSCIDIRIFNVLQVPVRDSALLNKVTMFLADNVGNTTSVNNIKNTLVSDRAITKGTTTGVIDNYINFLENAFVFYRVKRYDIKGKELLKTQGKYYISDLGLRNYLLGFKNKNTGHILENVVFMELKNRGYRVSICKVGNQEVDFIATTFNEKIYIQVCETLMSEETKGRELTPLKNIKDNYEKIILTIDKVFVDTDNEDIKIINLVDWLLR